jgi:hypothetical protein
MNLTDKITDEPADEVILTNDDVSEVWNRDDKAAEAAGWGTAHWYPADTDEDPMEWSELAGQSWQRLYRQSDVDEIQARYERTSAQLTATLKAFDEQQTTLGRLHAELAELRAKVAEEIAAAIESQDPVEAALAGQDAWAIAAAVARTHGKAATR